MFIFGVPYSSSCRDAGAFLNFLVAGAKYAIYKSRKMKIENDDDVGNVTIFKGFVVARLKLEFKHYKNNDNVKLFERKWCIGGAVCLVDQLNLVVTP